MKQTITRFFKSALFTLALLLGANNVNAQYTGTGTFTQITNLTDLTDGYYVITNPSGNVAMSNTYAGTFLATATVAPVVGVITDPSTAIVWKIETNGAGKTIYNEAVASYTSYTGSSNNVQMVSSVSTDNQRWTFTNTVTTFTIANLSTSSRKLQYNASSPRFACYTGTQQNVSLYKMAPLSGPEINFAVNSTSYANNSTYNFGTVTVGGTYTVQVGIQNTGTVNLNVSNITNTNTTEFVTNGATPPPFVVAPGGVATATLSFVPTVAGTFTNVLTLFNDDADESTYTVTFSGVAATPAPEINCLVNLATYTNNSTYSFGTVTVGGTYTAQLGVQNTGTANLNVSNLTVTNITEFIVSGSTLPPFVIAPGGVVTATLSFVPTVAGTFTNILTLFNNDADESTYTVTFTGVAQAAAAPEIDIVTTALNFGSIEENTTSDLTYVVQNTGTANLVLSTSATVPYSIVGTPPTTITAGSSATYTVRFSPTAIGTFTGTVTITSNDADEPSLNIALTGIATAALPTIFTETFGTPSATTLIPSYTGWSNSGFTFTGTGDVRSTTPSTSYTGASGGGNVFLTTGGTKSIEISNINTSTCSSFTLSFGIHKAQTGADGSDLLVEVSSDGISYSPLSFSALPAGAGTIGWYYRTATGTIPQAANLRIRFTNTAATTNQYRIDDVKLQGVCAPAPEINFVVNSTSHANNSTYNFGTVTVGGTYTVQLGIQNIGTVNLNVSNIANTNTTEFVTNGATPPPFVVAPGGVATATLSFVPTVAGTFTNILTLFNDDADESTYTVTFSGVATAPAPEINCLVNLTTYTNNSTYSFGTVTVGGTYTAQLGVQNTGAANLNVSNITNTNTTEFVTNGGLTAPFVVAPGGVATATLSFVPTVVGTFTNILTLLNNDADESTYTVTFTGVAQAAAAPEIDIVTTALNFGSIEENTTSDLTYVVQNTGTANLVLSTSTTAPYSIIGTAPTTITAGSSATYTVRFSPTATGTFTGTVTITSNDADEPSLTINLTGVATVAQPVIFTETFGTPSANTLITSYTGWSNSGFTFTGTGDVRSTTPSTSYTGASGGGNVFLTTGGTRNIEISGINTSACTGMSLSFGVLKSVGTANGSELHVEVSADGVAYTALTFPALPAGTGWNYVTASGTIPQATNLRIRFTNTSTTVQYRIDDVKLKGSCGPITAPEINVKEAATSIISGASYDFGTIAPGTKDVTFTIENTGTATLLISTYSITGAEFSLQGSMPTSVAAGSTANFTVRFSSSTPNSYTGSISIANNDADEANYIVNFTATVSNNTTFINDMNFKNEVSIFPNPNDGSILHFTSTANAIIYNSLGAKVIEVKNADKVDISTLDNGVYMVNIDKQTKRLIIAK